MHVRFQSTLIAIAMLLASTANAQVFRVQGGTSTLLNAEGGSVEFKAPNYDGSVGLGYYNGKVQFGAETRYLFHGYTLLAGDDSVPFTLPTDVFDSSHYFSARGIGATRKDANNTFYAFAGTTSTWFGTGFFNAASSDDPVAIFFFERKLSKELKFFSRDVVSNRQTSLQGLEYHPNKWLKASLTGGVGANQGYFASGMEAETEKLALKTSYVLTGDMFRRVTVISPMSSEVNKENVQMLYRPTEFVSITTGHENILEPLTPGGPMQQASVNQISSDFHIQRFYFGTGLFSSNASGRSTQGTNLYVGRRIGQRFEVNSNYFRSKPQIGDAQTILSGTIRENVSSRFSLLQLISRTAGQTTFALGGDFTSNRLLLRADYQNVYLPFRPERPFQQALALNVALRVAGPLQLTAASNVAPDGHLRYAFGASTYLYRLSGMVFNANSPDSFSIAKYVVQGIVKDDQGLPVEGAALHIGKQVAYTDSSGRFMVRFSKRGPFPFSIAPEEFITNGVYAVVSAPSQVSAGSEDQVNNVEVVVRRVPSRASNTPA
ncbi:MAG: hypothetical protein DMG97_04975 [Acidobacteria bacterium]|nr:MAG: hypothetical protein DMG97_04975 [Acidobacteriota bacterium]